MVTVIIPAYNCEDFIENTLNSIQQQTYTNFECIIINDGSTDKTGKIVQRKADNDKRFRQIITSNNGPAHARNTGINLARGEYICFIDADDIIHRDMFCGMMEKRGADVICCGYTQINENYQKDFLFEPFDAVTELHFRANLTKLLHEHLMFVVWNKLYKTSFIMQYNIRFANYYNCEDRLFNINTFEYIKSFSFVNKPYYNYYLRGRNSLVSKYLPNRFDAVLHCRNALHQAYINMNMEQDTSYMEFIFIKGVISCTTQISYSDCNLTQKQKNQYVRNLVGNDTVQKALANSNYEYVYSALLIAVLRTKVVLLIRIMSFLIYTIQFRFTSFYTKFKHRAKRKGTNR